MHRARASSSRSASLVPLAGSVALAQSAGLVGLPFTLGARRWYQELRRPSFAPPGEVFGPVWTVLYTLMGVAAWLVWRTPDTPARQRALKLYGAELALNAAWTPLFFGARRKRIALVDLLLLVGAVVATIRAFAKVRTAAAVLMVPYLMWTMFAGLLNASLVRLNDR